MRALRGGEETDATGDVEPEMLREVARQGLDALAALHARGWVHRDVKPGNVLCDSLRPLRVKLTDFGLASPAGRRGEPGNVSGSLPRYGTPKNSAIAGTCASRLGPL